jgi:hypothetical protein
VFGGVCFLGANAEEGGGDVTVYWREWIMAGGYFLQRYTVKLSDSQGMKSISIRHI